MMRRKDGLKDISRPDQLDMEIIKNLGFRITLLDSCMENLMLSRKRRIKKIGVLFTFPSFSNNCRSEQYFIS